MTNYRSRPFFFKMFMRLLEIYAHEDILRDAEARVKGIRQHTTQKAIEYYDAITKLTRKFGSAFTE